MTVRCYDVDDQTTYSAVVFAQSPGDATWIANLDLEARTGHQSTMMSAIERRVGSDGRAAEHLRTAIDADTPGIGHLQRDGSWLVLPPGERAARSIQPRPTEMSVHIDDEGDEVVVFTHDADRAGDLFDAIEGNFPLLPEGWMAHAWETWTVLGLVRHGIAARRRGVEGVGVYRPDLGWEILPLDYTALGIDPPDG